MDPLQLAERAAIMPCYVVATIKPWNINAFHRHQGKLPGYWQLISAPEDFNIEALRALRPHYVFFPHWSWRVPRLILQEFTCVCFHETDVPYGRGSSPVQNLILRGHKSTMLTALRMVDELDAGPVYLKRPLALDGRAEEIFERTADLIYDMIGEIVVNEPTPVAQQGEITIFTRRTSEQSVLPQSGSNESLYDFIRMLDAPTYPKAFIVWGEWRLEFDQVKMLHDRVEARVSIHKMSGQQ
jgi:methionyl-tRNA formyltransferase